MASCSCIYNYIYICIYISMIYVLYISVNMAAPWGSLTLLIPFSHGPTLSGFNPGLVLPFHMGANHCVRVASYSAKSWRF